MMNAFRDEQARRRAARALDKASDPHSHWYVFVILLVFALLITSLGIREMGAVPTLRYGADSPLAAVLANGGTVEDTTSADSLEAVAAAQTALGASSFLLWGIVVFLLGAALAVLLIAKKKTVWALTALPLLLCGVASLIQGIGGKNAAAAIAALPGAENLTKIPELFSLSAESQILVLRADLFVARWGILCLGLLLLLVGTIGLVQDRMNFKATVDSRTVKSVWHSLGVAGLVVVLYVAIIVTFMGCFYTIGTATNAAGLGEALNAYGRSSLTEVEEAISDAETSVTKAEVRLEEAKADLAAAEKKEAEAATEDEKTKAAKEVKKANKEIDKQQRKIEEAKAAREEAEQNYENAAANVKTYPSYSIADLFKLIDLSLPYEEEYGLKLDQMFAAIAADHAAEWNLTEDEMVVLAKKLNGYGISASDRSLMAARWYILIAGAVLMALVLFVGIRRHVLSLVFKHWFLSLFALISVFPFYWIVVSATNTSLDVTLGKLWFGDNLLVNIVNAAFTGALSRSFVNSLRNALLVTAGSLVISSAAGYGFVVYKDKAKDAVMKLLMLSMMVPAAATLVPLFRLFGANQLNILNTTWAVVLPSLATAFLIFMFRQGAQSFPKDLIEAARIDGMGEFGIFAKIFFPVMRPTYAAAATVTFMNAWNAYLWPLVALNTDEAQTMPIYIANILEGYVMDYGAIMLAVTISTLPTVIIFFFLQKSFVEGIIGSVKQ